MGNTSTPQKCKSCSSSTLKWKECQICKSSVCQTCWDYPVLNVPSEFTNLNQLSYKTACISCFKANVSIDFTTDFDIVGDSNNKEIIFVHGAGSCRKMFLPHANHLSKKGYRCILIDLPGHGSRMDLPLTMQACVKVIKEATQLCRTKDVTIIGGSLGGYVLMEALGVYPNLCQRAVVMMCGQNVGQGRGMLASFGLWFLNKSVKWFSQVKFATSILQDAQKNKHLNPQIIADFLKGGTYFKHGQQNIQLLKNGNYKVGLQGIKNKMGVLFINGSKDFRDSQSIWLQAAGDKSRLIVYEQADHYYSHDTRFYETLLADITGFIEK